MSWRKQKQTLKTASILVLLIVLIYALENSVTMTLVSGGILDSCDSLTLPDGGYWYSTSGANSCNETKTIDTADKVEGTGSIKTTGLANGWTLWIQKMQSYPNVWDFSQNPKIMFSIKSSWQTSNDLPIIFSIATQTGATQWETFTILKITTMTANQWTQQTVDLRAYEGTPQPDQTKVRCIIFQIGNSPATTSLPVPFTLWIDNIQAAPSPLPAPLSVNISPGSATITQGQTQTFTATVSGAQPPYTYNWFINGVSAGTDASFTTAPSLSEGIYYINCTVQDASIPPVTASSVTSTLFVSATSVQPQTTYILLIESAGNGTVSPPPGNHSYNSGTLVSLTATPMSGYKFSKWNIDGIEDLNNPTNVTMNQNHAATAYFTASSPSDQITNNQQPANPIAVGNDISIPISPLLLGGIAAITIAIIYMRRKSK